jgi:hypothetical protein
MRRHAGQKALYEAMSRSGSKRKRLGLLQRLRPQLEKLRKVGAAKIKRPAGHPEPAAEKPPPITLKPPKSVDVPEPTVQGPAQTWLRPKAWQFNEGRIEITLPYQFGIIIGLGLTLLVLIAFWFGHRLGQMDQRARYGRAAQSAGAAASGVPARTVDSGAGATKAEPSSPPANDRSATGAEPVGKNMIVLARHPKREDLEPVMAYFAEHGIVTGIVPYEKLRTHFAQQGLDASRLPEGDGFILAVRGLYENPEREGTDGNAVLKQIVELGRDYKAPPGKESFASNYFSDAYGMKIVP